VIVFNSVFWVALWFFGAFLGFVTGVSLLNIGVSGSPLFKYLWCFSFAYFGGILSVMWRDLEIVVL
jgi:hypothetical protein